MDRIEYLKLRRKDVLSFLRESTLGTQEYQELQHQLEVINNQMAEERINILHNKK